LNGGIVAVDKLLITNTPTDFTFRKGTLHAASLNNSNGRPFVVGDGTNASTLELGGGTFFFSNGLIVSSNATVTGCGTIIGSVQNFGSIATNCGSTGEAPSITTHPQNQTLPEGNDATFQVAAAGAPPLTYRWRFNGADLGTLNANQLLLNHVNRNQAGAYDVVVANSSGSVTSLVAHLRVLVPTTLTNIQYSGSSLQLSCSTEQGLNYRLEYKNVLSEPSWQPLKTLNGDGTPLSFVDTDALAPSRFYRIVVE
jgi:hypothetical protein